ncbi:UPF0182 family protein [soil metagenome]
MARQFTIPASVKRLAIILLVMAAVVTVMLTTASFWINWLWFDSVGYRDTLVARYRAEIVYTLLGAAGAALFFAGNLMLAMRRTRDLAAAGMMTRLTNALVLGLLIVGTMVLAILFGSSIGSRWEMWQLARFVPDYGVLDPVFDRDISFYLLRLPALSSLLDTIILLVFITGIATAVVYLVRSSVKVATLADAPHQMRVHVVALAGMLVMLMGLRYLLSNYQLVYSERGAAFGASFTDVNVQRWANYLLLIVSVAVGGLLLVNAVVKRLRPLLVAIAAWAVISIALGIVIPVVVQAVFVEPNELNRERPFIANNIAMTREGFGLTAVTERELTGTAPLEATALADHPATLNNIRLWDYRIARQTYQQLQSFVPYYRFMDVDVERYQTGDGIQQVLVSAREFDINGLPSGSQTWTNTHLVYTHGYAAVVSPVSEATIQGLPIFLVERIPPTGESPYEITRPEIYFGEVGGPWVAVHSEQPEFSGEISFEPGADTGYVYEGEPAGSISAGGIVNRVMLSFNLRDQNMFFTDQFNDDTRIIMKRDIRDRISTIAPFLTLDTDPYLVISEGRLYWIVDTYITSDRFPHASRVNGVNYVRNSVKVVVDAYSGAVDFYRTATPDPIADAYGKTYGEMFKPIDAVPADLASHFRYPEMLYEVQSDAYAEYHVTDPTQFYNGEDRWAIPQDQAEGSEGRMEPYYVTMTLPGEAEPGFSLIRPYIPGGRTDRQNMTAWMAGVADPRGINSLVAYRFPRQETVFGPSQVWARIDQEPDISSQISLWNQSGSEVLRGNLLVIPVGESVLYVQPLYLEARDSAGSLPEMKRVIVASSERVIMRPTLAEALIALTAESSIVSIPEETVDPVDADTEQQPETTSGEPSSLLDLTDQAVAAFERGQEALARGDWATYGEAQAELELILESMAAAQGSEGRSGATPQASPVAEE